MSRTDKTKPFWVKLKDHDLEWSEDHDHRHGPCTLPPLDSADAFDRKPRRCNRQFRYTGTQTCGCHDCAGLWHETKQQRSKRDRAKGKRSVREQATEELCTYIVPRPGESLLEIINEEPQ